MTYKTYNQWKEQLDKELIKLVGMTSDDLPDTDTYSSFECSEDPKEYAENMVREQCEEMGLECWLD